MIKQQPQDFLVEELTDVVPGEQGAFAFYRLDKKGWSTPDALAALRRRWDIALQRLSYGGLKDRHAQTTQYLTIRHGPRRNLTHPDVHVTYLGQTPGPYTAADIRANRFRITIRDLSSVTVAGAWAALDEVRRDGVPNYFDDQRFGSVARPGAPAPTWSACATGRSGGQVAPAGGGPSIGRLLIEGRFEEALRQALLAPYEYDRSAQKKEKSLLAQHWGDWAVLKERLPRGHARSLVDFLLHHPGDFRGAVARLRPELRGLYLSAYQSHLWNRMLARWLRQTLSAEQLLPVRLRLGEVPMHRWLEEEQRRALLSLKLPLPSARLHLEENDPAAAIVHAVLAEEGLELNRLKVKGIREMFFSKGERAALCLPEGLQADSGPDERHTGREKVTLACDLPRGCYATLLVKRLTTPG
jgi:tRNA pseudouridine13 synthase